MIRYTEDADKLIVCDVVDPERDVWTIFLYDKSGQLMQEIRNASERAASDFVDASRESRGVSYANTYQGDYFCLSYSKDFFSKVVITRRGVSE